MNKNAINKLRKKFILSSMMALIATMLVMLSLLFLSYTVISRQSIRLTLDYIINHGGEVNNISFSSITVKEEVTDYAGKESESYESKSGISEDESANEKVNEDESGADKGISKNYKYKDDNENKNAVVRFLNDIFATNDGYESPEFQYSVRYFAILYDEDGNISTVITNHIAAVSDSEAKEYGDIAKSKYFKFGRIDNYYYKYETYDDNTSIVVYLDSTQSVMATKRIFSLVVVLLAFGVIVTFIFANAFSKRAVQSEIKSIEAQNQFITNASHELKTPLAVIRANTEMNEMLGGENEWTKSTIKQVDRLNGLIKNLVLIVKSEEKLSDEEISDIDISALINDTVETYKSIAITEEKTLSANVPENVKMRAAETHIRQIATLLLDNAMKYCDDEGIINVYLLQKGKGIVFAVSNSYKEGANVDYSKFFDRFYREDKSHNVDKGGYGIGLSIAENITELYSGKIDVSWKDGIITFTCYLKFLK